MLKPEDFAWSLGGPARRGGSPRDAEKVQTPLGGALFPEAHGDSLDRHLDNSFLKASLAVHALVSVNLGFRALDPDLKQLVPTWGGVLFVQLSAGLYTICTVLLLGLSLGALLDPSILTLSRWDWHSYVIWSFYVFTEVLLFLSRLMARFHYLPPQNDHDNARRVNTVYWKHCYSVLILRKPYATHFDGLCNTFTQVVISASNMCGLLVIMSRVAENADHVVFLGWWWSGLFIFVAISYMLCATMDALRVDEISCLNWHFSLELFAWRFLFLMVASPVLAGGWVIAQNVCCRGGWYITEY